MIIPAPFLAPYRDLTSAATLDAVVRAGARIAERRPEPHALQANGS